MTLTDAVQRLAEIGEAIEAFNDECLGIEYTDTDEAFGILTDAQRAIQDLLEAWDG